MKTKTVCKHDIPKNIRVERFFSKIRISKTDGCWNWIGAKSKLGYGTMMRNKKILKSHRVSYSIFKGSLDKNMVIDHTCRNKSCVNPRHLRQVTVKINTIENSNSCGANNSNMTKCKNGHDFNTENTYIYNGTRTCRVCRKLKARKRNSVKIKIKPMSYIYKEDIAYRVKIKRNGRMLSIGRFKTVDDAIHARDEFLKQEFFGECK